MSRCESRPIGYLPVWNRPQGAGKSLPMKHRGFKAIWIPIDRDARNGIGRCPTYEYSLDFTGPVQPSRRAVKCLHALTMLIHCSKHYNTSLWTGTSGFSRLTPYYLGGAHKSSDTPFREAWIDTTGRPQHALATKT